MVYEAVDSRLSGLYTGLIHPEFDVRRAYNPHSSVVPITRIEGYGYTLLSIRIEPFQDKAPCAT